MDKKKVLIPIDGSVFSQHILPQMRAWFHPNEAEIILFYVAGEPAEGTGVYADIMHDDLSRNLVSGKYGQREVEYAKHPIYTTQVEASIVVNAKADLLRDKNLLKENGFTVSTEVAFGDPTEQIVAYSKRHNIDLIAMTTHGRTGVRRLLMGSVAAKVLSHVNIPVMLLRPFESKGFTVDV